MKLYEFCKYTFGVERIFVYWDKVGRQVFDGTTAELVENFEAYGRCDFIVYQFSCGIISTTNEPYITVNVSKVAED